MQLDIETVNAVRDALRGSAQVEVARRCGVSQGTVSHIMHGRAEHVSLCAQNRVRVALGLAALPPTVEVPACPDCNGVHTGRCHGKPVVVRPMRRRTWSRWADAPVSVLAEAIRQRTTI